MNSMIIIMIVGMAVVTYLPRLIPFVMFQGKELPPFVQAVLKNVPYATLGALIVPGIFLINEDVMYGIIGAAVALFVAYLGANVILVVISAIAALSVYSWLVS
ncbi:MAG: AzlD domain-containing protein [Bacillota bacterium]|uniref:AzlD domain-containing protein n=1 Tax=Bacillus sp. RO2 TaxID=2723913 RepID=UPI00145C6BB5|nr:AzlD domain-containing protein [Bacillus sp. RO2]MEA3322272.1 AzlD domain-containing protein [Bacillota bacterium]NMH73652.1 AzlD domain-containing protein [Bacillus sp. RO2]